AGMAIARALVGGFRAMVAVPRRPATRSATAQEPLTCRLAHCARRWWRASAGSLAHIDEVVCP
ncbi:hypothetical protein, partial [Klebsiella pneumoniae]|uniref:hypothetical protein n=1 Tax=Klebsiella pneumoniae TaxID=573 RepID=UPI0025A09A2B